MWVRLESNFFGHPKVEGLDDHAITLYFRALCRAGDQNTDGRVATSLVKGKRQTGLADRLVGAGLWHRAKGLERVCARCWEALGAQPGDGWVIHDFLKYNPSKAEVEDRRAHDRQRKERSRGSGSGNPTGVPQESAWIPTPRTVRPDGTTDPREETESSAITNGRPKLTDEQRAKVRDWVQAIARAPEDQRDHRTEEAIRVLGPSLGFLPHHQVKAIMLEVAKEFQSR